jgi:surface carbohydrate biosynthesis protein
MHFYLHAFPKSIYLSKSTTNASKNVFRYLGKMGSKIAVWDEEALVALPPRLYYRHRLSPKSINYVSHLLAWGEQNAKLWRQYPNLPKDIPIHITGNPRGDLLRSELRGYYEDDVKALREEYGDFVLVNSNFNLINAYHTDMNLLMPGPNPGDGLVLSRRSKSLGLDREYAEGFTAFKKAILKSFEELVPALAREFPDYTIVLRPHPAENQEIYHRLGETSEGVRVINKGNVVPWLLAARALIHNGCTTGIEAYALGTPALAYRKIVEEQYDRDFHQLPNALSHECFSFVELKSTLKKILDDQLGVADGDERKALLNRNLAAQSGPLACERVIDVLEKIIEDMSRAPEPSMLNKLKTRVWSNRRRLKKRLRGYRSNMSHNRADFLKHRYPNISLEEMRQRVARFQRLLGHDEELKVEQFANQFFRISRHRN